jgi:hypothetical protein
LAVATRYYLSAKYDFRSGLAAMKRAASLPAQQRTQQQISKAWKKSQSGNYDWVKRIVPTEATLLLMQSQFQKFYYPYLYFDNRHQRRVRLLSNWNESDFFSAHVRNLCAYLEQEAELWLLAPEDTKVLPAAAEKISFSSRKIGQHRLYAVYRLNRLQP